MRIQPDASLGADAGLSGDVSPFPDVAAEPTSHPDAPEMNGLPVSNDNVVVGLNDGGPYLTALPAAAAVRWLALPEILSIRPD